MELRVNWTCWVLGAPPASPPASIPWDAVRVSLPPLEAVDVHPRAGCGLTLSNFLGAVTRGSPLTLEGAAEAYREEMLGALALTAKLLRGVSVTVKSGLLKARIIEWVDLGSSFRAISPHMHLVILHWKHTGEIISFLGAGGRRSNFSVPYS